MSETERMTQLWYDLLGDLDSKIEAAAGYLLKVSLESKDDAVRMAATQLEFYESQRERMTVKIETGNEVKPKENKYEYDL